MGFVGVYETEGKIVPAHCMEYMSFKGPFNPNYSMVLLEKTPPCVAAEAKPRLLEASWRSPGPQLSQGKAMTA